MPHDANNMFGVLADPELMRNLGSRGRSKPFEKDIAQAIAQEQQEARQIADARQVADDIDAELERMMLESDGEEEGELSDEADQAATQAVNTPATPAPPRFQHLDLPAEAVDTQTPRSGKPSHRRRRDRRPSIPEPPASPTPSAPPPRELFTFTARQIERYKHACTLFSTASQTDHPSSLRWGTLVSLLTSPPMSCVVLMNKGGGSSCTVVRPQRLARVGTAATVAGAGPVGGAVGAGQAQEDEEDDQAGAGEAGAGDGEDGEAVVQEVLLPKRSVVIHRPHGGGAAWVTRNMLENMARAFAGRFGWERGDFRLV